MYLSNLEIVGFKSFANKTMFRFSEGMTALVGPNGCGKSNIVDSIRWVLGEQKTSVLRSDIMENVIFNGTGKRKPLGMAEVSIVIQNNKQKLPSEYTEVKVTRRLFRNGESNYLINNAKCRLRDVNDLFMDTGMGPDSYSVIELKMVEAILSGKPEERRHLFEEAAGVTKYKIRRKEAARKLLSVQQDLQRVADIVVEIEKNVNSLSRQASKTRRYNKLMAEHKELDLKLLKHDFLVFGSDKGSIEELLKELQIKRNEKEEDISRSEESLNELKMQLTNLNHKYREVRDRENAINSEIAQKTKDIAVFRERIASIESNRDRLNHEITGSADNIKSLSNAVAEAENNLAELRTKKEQAGDALDEIRSERDEILSRVTEFRDDTNIANENVINIQNRINTLKSDNAKNRSRKENLENSISENEKEIENIRSSLEEISSEYDQKVIDKAKLEEKVLNAEKELKYGHEKQEQLQKTIDNLQDEVTEQKNLLSRNNAALEFYRGFIDADESSKFLIESAEWMPDKEKVMLAELIGAADDHRVAVETALGESARYFVVDTRKDAYQAFQTLQEYDKGKSAFICRESIPKISAPEDSVIEEGVIGWLSEIVRADDDIKYVIRGILGRTLLVENIQKAIEVVDLGMAEAAVTLDGEFVNKKGIMKGGSLTDTEGLAVGKKERMEKLEKENWNLNKIITELAEELRITKSNHSAIDISALNQKLRIAESEKSANENVISQLDIKKENFLSRLASAESSLGRLNEELASIDSEIQSFESSLDETESNLMLAREELQLKIKDVAEAESELEQWDIKAREAEKELVRLNTEISNMEREIRRLGHQKEEIITRRESMKDELVKSSGESEQLINNISGSEAELEGLKSSANEALSEKEFLKEQTESLEEQINSYSADISAKRRELEKTIEKLHEKDINYNEVKGRLDSLYARAREGFEIDLDELEQQPEEDFSVEEARQELRIIKEKLAGIGNVNFMALEEYETQSQRLEFYTAQVKDLTDSEKTLQETIEEINRTAEEKFSQTFEIVHNNFKNLFKKLFGGDGEASLHLKEGNPLETDIEIIAKPPNKRPNSIEALSSGEKTLTAISLLFAIYLVKPSPFCILDEVDAPLDDANIDKFLNLIKEFSIETQFMIVTHNKRTMSAANTLYGITMEEEGLSKVVSVQLNETKN